MSIWKTIDPYYFVSSLTCYSEGMCTFCIIVCIQCNFGLYLSENKLQEMKLFIAGVNFQYNATSEKHVILSYLSTIQGTLVLSDLILDFSCCCFPVCLCLCLWLVFVWQLDKFVMFIMSICCTLICPLNDWIVNGVEHNHP